MAKKKAENKGCKEPVQCDDKKWQVESDVRILKEAIEVIEDKKRFKSARDLAESQARDLKKLSKMSTEEFIEHRNREE